MSDPWGSVYYVPFGPVAVSGAIDFVEFSPVANRPVRLVGCVITQSSEPATEEEQLRVEIIRGHATSGSGGSAFTPIPRIADEAAAGFACEINNTTLASAGTPVVLHGENFNSRVGFHYWPPPEAQPIFKLPTTGGVIRLTGAPVDPITFQGVAIFTEY